MYKDELIYYFSNKSLEGYLQQKYQNKNTLQGFGGGTYSKNSKYKETFFLVFPMYKKAKYKNGCYYQRNI